jgi:thymidylate kinase
MKIAYTGSHGTGKTTACHKRSFEEKLSNTSSSVLLISEVARKCPIGINGAGGVAAQAWMYAEQLREEIEASHFYSIIICDRTVADVYAYSLYFGYVEFAKSIYSSMRYWLKTYDEIIFKTIKNNDYCFDDGQRMVDSRVEIERILVKIYDTAGIHFSEE